jgi:hypothetical protein
MTGRKKIWETITAEGRDKGKTFVITEMGALKGKKWVMDLYADGKGRDNAELLSLLDEPKFAAWRDCVQYSHDRKHPDQPIPWDEVTCQVDEIATVLFLQSKVLELHTSFFSPVSP